MDLMTWIAVYLVSALFWAWIVFFGGADQIEDSFVGQLLTSLPNCSAEGLRLLGGFILTGQSIWFVVGLMYAPARLTLMIW